MSGQLPVDLGPKFALGRYMTEVTCAECHGPKLEGDPKAPMGRIPNLIVAGSYSPTQFATLMAQGIAAGNRKINPVMTGVARTRFSHFTPRERDALYAYFESASRAFLATPTVTRLRRADRRVAQFAISSAALPSNRAPDLLRGLDGGFERPREAEQRVDGKANKKNGQRERHRFAKFTNIGRHDKEPPSCPGLGARSKIRLAHAARESGGNPDVSF